jgi:hypothetical protein
VPAGLQRLSATVVCNVLSLEQHMATMLRLEKCDILYIFLLSGGRQAHIERPARMHVRAVHGPRRGMCSRA